MELQRLLLIFFSVSLFLPISSAYAAHIITYPNSPREDQRAGDKLPNKGFLLAAYRGDVTEFARGLKLGADVNTQNARGKTALICAVEQHGDLTIIKELLENKANVNIVDEFGQTALIYAVLNKDIPVIQLLLRNGASIDIVDENGHTARYYATPAIYEIIQQEEKTLLAQNLPQSSGFVDSICNMQ